MFFTPILNYFSLAPENVAQLVAGRPKRPNLATQSEFGLGFPL